MMTKSNCLAAVLASMAILALSVLGGCGRSGASDNVVARFKGGLLTIEDLSAHLRMMKTNPRFRSEPGMVTPQSVFDHAVNMEMIIAKGLKEKLHLDPSIRTEIHWFMADLFLKAMQERLVSQIDKQSILEEEVSAYFEAHPENYRGRDFETSKEYVRNDLLYALYRDAWQAVYDKLKAEFELEVMEENLAPFLSIEEKMKAG